MKAYCQGLQNPAGSLLLSMVCFRGRGDLIAPDRPRPANNNFKSCLSYIHLLNKVHGRKRGLIFGVDSLPAFV